MSAVLLTGMSGVGVSTVLRHLGDRGYATIDTDDPGWAQEVPSPDGGIEQVWVEERMTALLDGQADAPLVVAGCATNQGRFYARFDAVVLLSAPVDVMLERIERRTKPFGKSAADRARILADVAHVEPLLRATCSAEVRTDRPLADVVADVDQFIRRL